MSETPYTAEVANITDTPPSSGADIIVEPPLPAGSEALYSAALGGTKRYATIKHIATTDRSTTLHADTEMGDGLERRTAHLQQIARKICELAAKAELVSVTEQRKARTSWRPTRPAPSDGRGNLY